MITIIDYGSGNLRSIANSFVKIGSSFQITNNPETIANAKFLVLPGVGAFGKAMENILPYKDVICEHISNEKPFLGICLGLQILLSKSEENPNIKGLDIFKGTVKKIPNMRKVPHIGWNQLNGRYCIENSQENICPILKGIDKKFFYFVHSYYAHIENDDIVVGRVHYGSDIAAVLHEKNIFATQFHPEKSGKDGLKLLKNFVSLE